MVNEQNVQIILGPRSWEETASVAAEVVSPQHHHNNNIPILSLSDYTPSWSTSKWPFLFQASPTKNSQMKAISAIIESFQWRRVNVIYENMDSFSTIIPLLHHALQEIGAQISNLISLSQSQPFDSSELLKLKENQCRVFVVHVSVTLGITLFRAATELKMMENGYVWITSDTVTNHVHYFNSSTFSTMQGLLGVRSYYDNKNMEFDERFEDKFGSMFPREKSYESGSFAVEAYDAAWTAALAVVEKGKSKVKIENLYRGLKGENLNVFQIINVLGKSDRELGFWSIDIDGIGFFDASMKRGNSIDILGQIIWPGGLVSVPRGWKIPSKRNPLKIGVPNHSMNHRFVKVTYNPSWDNYSFSGFSIDVFVETVKRLPYFLPYTFIPFNGTYSELVENVRLKVPIIYNSC